MPIIHSVQILALSYPIKSHSFSSLYSYISFSLFALLLPHHLLLLRLFYCFVSFYFILSVNTVMSTAKRLVLSLRGRKESQTTAGTSSTRLVSANSLSPGHELDEIAVVSGSGDSCHALSYGSLSQPNGPSYTG